MADWRCLAKGGQGRAGQGIFRIGGVDGVKSGSREKCWMRLGPVHGLVALGTHTGQSGIWSRLSRMTLGGI